jgi:hypothetical protein
MNTANTTPHDHPPRRLVLLGASNVTLAIPIILDAALQLWGRPLDVLAAYGHGRSYGQRHALLWRELPGIVECGLWQALEHREPAPTAALITDIGNDLLYEAPVADIVGWVETCCDRLQRAAASIALTPLPLCNVTTVSRARYLLLRSVLYPACRLDYAVMLQRAFELDERLRALARQRGLVLVEPRPEWYGFDKIHIRQRYWYRAWREMLASSSSARPVGDSAATSTWPPLRLRFLAPECRWIFGGEQHTPQPTVRLRKLGTLALY